MDSSPKPTGIPRYSRLPVPRSGVKASPSVENLQSSRIGGGGGVPATAGGGIGLSSSRLRSVPSRDQLSTTSKRGPAIPLRSKASSQQLRSRDSIPTATRAPTTTPTTRKTSGILRPQASFHRQQVVQKEAAAEEHGWIHVQDEFKEEQLPLQEDATSEYALRETDGNEGQQQQTPRKPSLSERAMDTLQNTPVARRRKSSFFNSESPMRPSSSGTFPSRPGSSLDGAMRPPSRPGSRADPAYGSAIDFRASTNTFRAPSASSSTASLLKKPSVSSLRTPSGSRMSASANSISRLPSPGFKSQRARSPSPQGTPRAASFNPASKTLSARSLKPRASVNGLFRKPSAQTLNQDVENDQISFGDKRRPTALSNTSNARSSTPKSLKANTVTPSSDLAQETTPRKSSMALRDQIAKAKAAKRAAANPPRNESLVDVPVIPADDFDFGLSENPFGQQAPDSGSKGLLKKRIQSARGDGRLNIAAMGFKEIPNEVMTMYDLDTNDGSWAECVDLTRFVAAGNEIVTISDDIFPDVDPRDYVDDDDAKGNQFGGLETLDLHGNLLVALPLGLRRLEFLTTLNVANNKLDNGCFEVISKITSLRDLKIGNNELSGTLDSRITDLINLESLDVQHNALTSLPEGLGNLSKLRMLNMNENRLTGFPFDHIQSLPLTELLIAKNKLAGTLIGSAVESMPLLQVLDITANAVTSLTMSENLSLPALHQLGISYNRFTSLPDISTWTSLRTLTAEDNNIDSIPEGFVALRNLRNVDLRGNNIKSLDDQIGNMENLDILRITGNPLREKKFAGMTTEDLKRTLKSRLEPVTPSEASEKEADHEGSFFSASTSPLSPTRPNSSDWPVLPGGILDRSNLKVHSLNPVAAADVSAGHQIVVLELHHNIFREIPSSIGFFAATLTTLNMSHNELNSDSFLNEELDLPALKELNLSSNTFNSLQPLLQRLQAPNLVKLDISFNRVTTLLPLKQHFPNLVTLFASNNTIRELLPESVKGLMTLDCSSNEINSLNARLGLLGGPGGLQRLDVTGNRFRVPKYTVLEKGTEATLAWLRDRIPAGEGGSVDEAVEVE